MSSEEVDRYIAAFPKSVQRMLKQIRAAIRQAAPDAEEVISYRMPAFKQRGIIVYYAAWKNHIGLYPPVHGDKELEADVAPFAGPKGNLQFPLDAPMPLDLIRRIVSLRLSQIEQKKTGKRQSKSPR